MRRQARFCLATKMPPSEYRKLTTGEVAAFYAELNGEPTEAEAHAMASEFASRLREE